MIDYYTITENIDLDVIALSEFGGERGDREGAILRVNGWARVSVVMPRSVVTGGPQIHQS